jgi:hypothetical protein
MSSTPAQMPENKTSTSEIMSTPFPNYKNNLTNYYNMSTTPYEPENVSTAYMVTPTPAVGTTNESTVTFNLSSTVTSNMSSTHAHMPENKTSTSEIISTPFPNYQNDLTNYYNMSTTPYEPENVSTTYMVTPTPAVGTTNESTVTFNLSSTPTPTVNTGNTSTVTSNMSSTTAQMPGNKTSTSEIISTPFPKYKNNLTNYYNMLTTPHVVTPAPAVSNSNEPTVPFTISTSAQRLGNQTSTSQTSGVSNELGMSTSGIVSATSTPSPAHADTHGNMSELDMSVENEITNTTSTVHNNDNSKFPLIQIVAIWFSYFVVFGFIVTFTLYKRRLHRGQPPDLVLDYSSDNIEQTDIVVNV